MGEKQIKPIDKKLVRDLFNYVNGCLIWKVNKGRAKIGQKAHVNSTKYKVFKICGKQYLEHRLIWAWHYNEVPKYIDHINGDYLDNRIENLRPATHSQNMRNSKRRIDNTSGIKGVYWSNDRKCWKVQIWADGKQQYLGAFKNINDAQIVANQFRLNNHKNFANLGVKYA